MEAFTGANESRLFLQYYRDLGELKPELDVGPSSVLVRSHDNDLASEKPAIQGRDLDHSGLELRDVSFRYHQSYPWVLRGLNLAVPHGLTMAVVGINGAGKSTLVKLLARLYDPSEGSILWNGVDLRDLSVKEWRNEIGVVYQDFMNYDTTIRENIGVGDLSEMGNDKRLHELVDLVGLSEQIRHLQSGLDTEASLVFGTGPTGVDLSVGQWQKIALARMLLRRSQLLLPDEPTAALDATSEYQFNTRFAEIADGRTSLLISHRLSTVRAVDVVAVLEGGAIIEVGAHADLLSTNPTYSKLCGSPA